MNAGFNPNAANLTHLQNLQSGKLAGSLADKSGNTQVANRANVAAPKGKNTQVKSNKAPVSDEVPQESSVSLSKNAAAELQQKAEKGELQDLADQAGHDITGGQRDDGEDQKKLDDVAKDVVGRQPDGTMRLKSDDGVVYTVPAPEAERLEKLTGSTDQHLDDMEHRVLGDIPDKNLAAAEGVLKMQTAKGVSAAATLKPLDPSQELERNAPYTKLAGAADMADTAGPGSGVTKDIPLQQPSSVEADVALDQAAKLGASKAADAKVAELGNDPVVKQAMDAQVAKDAQKIPQPMTVEQAKEIQANADKGMAASYDFMVSCGVQTNGLEAVYSQIKSSPQGQQMTDFQAGAAARQYLQQPEVQKHVGSMIDGAVKSRLAEHEKVAQAEAQTKGIQLSKEDSQCCAMIAFGKEVLGKASSTAPQMSSVLGKDSGITDFRDVVLKHTTPEGKVDSNSLAVELQQNFSKAAPIVDKKINELMVQVRDAGTPAEKEKLMAQIGSLQDSLNCYGGACGAASSMNWANLKLRAAETIKTKGASSEPKVLTEMTNGKLRVDGAQGLSGSPAEAQSNALYEQYHGILKSNKSMTAEDAQKMDDLTEANANKMAKGKDDPLMGEYIYLAQASEIANWAQSRLAGMDPKSDKAQDFVTINRSALAYIESREAYLEQNAPGSLKTNPQYMEFKSQISDAKNRYASRPTVLREGTAEQ